MNLMSSFVEVQILPPAPPLRGSGGTADALSDLAPRVNE